MEIRNDIRKKIDELLIQHDVLKLIGEGAPEDEYRPYIPQIYEFIVAARTEQELAEKIEGTFVKALAPADDLADFSDYLDLAMGLFKLKNR